MQYNFSLVLLGVGLMRCGSWARRDHATGRQPAKRPLDHATRMCAAAQSMCGRHSGALFTATLGVTMAMTHTNRSHSSAAAGPMCLAGELLNMSGWDVSPWSWASIGCKPCPAALVLLLLLQGLMEADVPGEPPPEV